MGTLNLLEASTKLIKSPKIVVATTDKVYKNDGPPRRFSEIDPLGGKDPYSWSKVGTESVVGAYQQISKIVNGPEITSVRSGNVIGGGDKSIDRLLPDLIQGTFEKKKITIRNPKSTRPWQHVLDPLWGYLLAITNDKYENAFNFSPKESSLTVNQVLQIAKENLPIPLEIDFQQQINDKESLYLELNSDKSRKLLNWRNFWDQESAIKSTIEWWKNVNLNGFTVAGACDFDIKQFLESKINAK